MDKACMLKCSVHFGPTKVFIKDNTWPFLTNVVADYMYGTSKYYNTRVHHTAKHMKLLD